MGIATREIGKHTIVDLDIGENGTISEEVSKQLADLVQSGSRNLVLNLSGAPMLASQPMGNFVALWKTITGINGTLEIIAGNQDTRDHLVNLSLNAIIRIFNSEGEFITALNEKKDEISTTIRQKGNYRIVQMAEPLEIFWNREELDRILERLFKKGYKFLALDMSSIIHAYSEVIGTMIKWHKACVGSGGKFCLINLSQDLENRLGQMGILKVLPDSRTEEDLA